MYHRELKLRCDLFKTGSNTHKINTHHSVVLNVVQLHLMGTCDEYCYGEGVKHLQLLNSMLHTNYTFEQLVESYAPVLGITLPLS